MFSVARWRWLASASASISGASRAGISLLHLGRPRHQIGAFRQVCKGGFL